MASVLNLYTCRKSVSSFLSSFKNDANIENNVARFPGPLLGEAILIVLHDPGLCSTEDGG